MPLFSYRVAKTDGTILQRQAEAEDEARLKERLEVEGLLVLSLAPATGFASPLSLRAGLSARDFLAFNHELRVLLKAGLPIMQVLDILSEGQWKPAFSAALKRVQQGVREGSAISDAMARYPAFFPELYVASLRAGEKSGNLVEVIGRFMVYQRKLIDLRKKVFAALAYPSFLLLFGGLVLAFLIFYVIPTFAEMYEGAQKSLPLVTRILLGAVHYTQTSMIVWLPGGVLGLFLLYRSYQSERGRAFYEKMALRLPILGPIVQRNYLIRITRTLSTILKSGMPVVGALGIMSESMGNRVVRRQLEAVDEEIRRGGKLSVAFSHIGFFPKITVEMIGVGEMTGSLEEMLNEVADFHEEEMDLYLSRVTTWIEPALLMVVGLVIAFVLVAMYLPIFQLAGTIQ
jgi:type IV pilus assembly protein PilC